jgi:uncharacterized protein YfeS
MFKNESVKISYNKLLNTYSESESNYIITNSLAILGDKKINPSKETKLSEASLNRINRYKYPERLVSLINITINKTEEWANSSFTKLALQQ